MKSNRVILYNLRKTNDMLQRDLKSLNNKINDALFNKKLETPPPTKAAPERDNQVLVSKRIELYDKEIKPNYTY